MFDRNRMYEDDSRFELNITQNFLNCDTDYMIAMNFFKWK